MAEQRLFEEIIGDIYAEYETNAGLYDPVRGIHVPPLDGPEYSVSAAPLTGQPAADDEPHIRVSLGEHGAGGPIYTVKPDEIAYNPGRALGEDDDFYIYSADDDVFLTDTVTARKMLRFVQGAHRHARAFKRQSP